MGEHSSPPYSEQTHPSQLSQWASFTMASAWWISLRQNLFQIFGPECIHRLGSSPQETFGVGRHKHSSTSSIRYAVHIPSPRKNIAWKENIYLEKRLEKRLESSFHFYSSNRHGTTSSYSLPHRQASGFVRRVMWAQMVVAFLIPETRSWRPREPESCPPSLQATGSLRAPHDQFPVS